MSPRRPQMSLRRPQMTPRRAKRSPRRTKVSSGRLPGAFWEGFPTHFQATRGDRDAPYSNRRRGRVAPRARLQAGAAARMFSQPSPGSSQKAPKKTHEKLTAVPRGALLASSRRCLCSFPRLLRRLRCLQLSLFTRFPFLDSQVSLFRSFF